MRFANLGKVFVGVPGFSRCDVTIFWWIRLELNRRFETMRLPTHRQKCGFQSHIILSSGNFSASFHVSRGRGKMVHEIRERRTVGFADGMSAIHADCARDAVAFTACSDCVCV